jgi:hypothetical protein
MRNLSTDELVYTIAHRVIQYIEAEGPIGSITRVIFAYCLFDGNEYSASDSRNSSR